MRQPDDVAQYLRQRFDRDYPDWARGQGAWPLRVSLQPPTTSERCADPVACHAWNDGWQTYPGPGVVEYANLRFPTATHSMPKTLVLLRPGDVAAIHPDTLATWKRCGHRLTSLQRDFPNAEFTGIIRRLTELPERDYQRLYDAVTWLHHNPASGMLLRQLPIEGIDTKWLSAQAHLVLALLGTPDTQPSEQTDTDDTDRVVARRLRLHERLGLRVPPDLIQVAVLDPTLREQVGGMRHLAASIDDLNQWPRPPHTVVIIENKETGYALTEDHPEAVALHGLGCSVAHYARITWVRTATRVIYWGDIDIPGLQFVNDLRGHGVPATTILMDTETLERFAHLAVDGATPQRAALPYLTPSEANLYQRLTDHSTTHGAGLLLEQERIPWHHAHQTLIAALEEVERIWSAGRPYMGQEGRRRGEEEIW